MFFTPSPLKYPPPPPPPPARAYSPDAVDQEHARGYYHVVRRDGPGGGLRLVPYSEEYRVYLVPAAKLLEVCTGVGVRGGCNVASVVWALSS